MGKRILYNKSKKIAWKTKKQCAEKMKNIIKRKDEKHNKKTCKIM